MKVVEVALSKKPTYELKLQMSKKQLAVLQDALGYAAWQFYEGGGEPESSIKMLNDLYDEIKKQTGIEQNA